ncbi:hypothetical protein AVEN_259510-1 [Araneus ventricosus]|uniref:Uncharacterized protein n=1 Tax=Araneus ventricosus TaxID=182803 RepID=A0A4Y2KJB7_ARAVE|nr:hypothetical protein AVEN_259510-1 [Araneus ventricosus]
MLKYSTYDQEHILSPFFKCEIRVRSLYPQCHQSVELQQDKAGSHTSQSTVNFMERIEHETGIKAAPFTDTSDKSPDVSSLDFAFLKFYKAQYPSVDLQSYVDLGKLFNRNEQNTSSDTTKCIIVKEVTM